MFKVLALAAMLLLMFSADPVTALAQWQRDATALVNEARTILNDTKSVIGRLKAPHKYEIALEISEKAISGNLMGFSTHMGGCVILNSVVDVYVEQTNILPLRATWPWAGHACTRAFSPYGPMDS